MRKVRTIQKVPFAAPDVVTKPVPAPTEGWDAISPLAVMDPKRAPILDNWVPRPGWVELRAGFVGWSLQIVDAPIESLMVRRAPGGQQMFAAGGGNIYDVTIAGGSSVAVSGQSSNRWQYVNFTPGGGTAVIQAVNGADPLLMYDGATWSIAGVTPGFDITGLPAGKSTADFIQIYAQKRRLWYMLKDTTIAAFMPTDAINGGIAGTLDFGALWTKGGYLVAMSDWTIDGGNGPQDYAAFISSQGQLSIYSGVDPTDATTWTLTGTFDLPVPIGRRCMTKVGSDVAIITMQGVLPMSQALPFDPSSDRSVAITARIQNAMAQACAQAANNFGWQVISYPAEQFAILNVPLTENAQQVQFVMNALTGAWCRFLGWNANVFEIYNNLLYFGDDSGSVNQAYEGGLDLDQPIAADMQCAFNWFDDPGRTKRMTMIQPLLTASGAIQPLLSVDADFATSTAVAPITILQGGALWDVALWDVATWPEASIIITNWDSVDALGHALAVRMRVNVSGTEPGVTLEGFDFGKFDTAEFDAFPVSGGSAPILQVNAFNAIMELGGFI